MKEIIGFIKETNDQIWIWFNKSKVIENIFSVLMSLGLGDLIYIVGGK